MGCTTTTLEDCYRGVVSLSQTASSPQFLAEVSCHEHFDPLKMVPPELISKVFGPPELINVPLKYLVAVGDSSSQGTCLCRYRVSQKQLSRTSNSSHNSPMIFNLTLDSLYCVTSHQDGVQSSKLTCESNDICNSHFVKPSTPDCTDEACQRPWSSICR